MSQQTSSVRSIKTQTFIYSNIDCPEKNGTRSIKNLLIRCRYGTCSLCSCVGFDPDPHNDSVCRRCGHSYDEHQET